MDYERKCLNCKSGTPSKSENHLCDECTKSVKSISLIRRGIGKAIANHIIAETNRLAKNYRLQAADKDTILQDLTIRALEAKQDYNEKIKANATMKANITTYVKSAVSFKAVDIANAIQNAPSYANVDDILRATELNERHRIAKNPDEPYKPLTISTGGVLQHLATDHHEHDLTLKMDIKAIMEALTPQQRQIVEMLEDGKTHEKISNKLGMSRSAITKSVRRIRYVFYKFLK